VRKEGGQKDGEAGMTENQKECPLLQYIYGMMHPVSF
jgi:hypothetical protein